MRRPSAVRVRVPASSANLGPGFDAFGLALARHDVVEASVTSGGLSVTVDGEGAGEVDLDERHLVVRAMRATFARLDFEPAGLALRCTNRIPHGRGLGSSAAAIVAGAVAAAALAGVLDAQCRDAGGLLLDVTTELEGHPDNVAACLLGGATLAWSGTDGVQAIRLPLHEAIAPLVFIPRVPSSTEAARGLLPPAVPHADAAANAARAALLVEALGRRPDLLFPATDDRLHQQYRAAAMPETAELIARLRAERLSAVVSGAGPSVLMLGVGARHDAARTVAGAGWEAHFLRVDVSGARCDVLE